VTIPTLIRQKLIFIKQKTNSFLDKRITIKKETYSLYLHIFTYQRTTEKSSRSSRSGICSSVTDSLPVVSHLWYTHWCKPPAAVDANYTRTLIHQSLLIAIPLSANRHRPPATLH